MRRQRRVSRREMLKGMGIATAAVASTATHTLTGFSAATLNAYSRRSGTFNRPCAKEYFPAKAQRRKEDFNREKGSENEDSIYDAGAGRVAGRAGSCCTAGTG